MAVHFHINGKDGPIRTGQSLFDAAESFGVRVPTSCIKLGKCKECMVEVVTGMDLLSSRTPEESHLRDQFRLSCRTTVVSDAGEVRCHTMRRGELQVERHAYALPVFDRPPDVQPCVTRSGDAVLIDGVEVDRRVGPIHGLAMDLGTTTIVVRLFDLETGEVVADTSFENPQRFGGSDVMSRIHFDTHSPRRVLRRTLLGYIKHAIEELPVDPLSIYEMVVAGNSTMRDIFFGLDVYTIGQSPYRSITELERDRGERATTSLSASVRRFALPLNPRARVYGLPIISGHVGADAAACMLAIDLAHEERLVALMDIGTNTELLLGNRHRILAASCPAGPAFEGGSITFGMPALPGAIERVRAKNDGTFDVDVIGGVGPEGICGSGLVDALSELLRTGRLNALGRFEDGSQEAVLHAESDPSIALNEKDINELAQAKGANVAGLHVVFSEYGASFDDVDVFYLAGGFGRHLDVSSAKRVGLIPNIDNKKIVQAGNASIEGASLALLSRTKRAELEALVQRVTHCRLETDPDFFHYFVEGCQFNTVETIQRRQDR